jgi:hypothetical protein
MLFDIIDTL